MGESVIGGVAGLAVLAVACVAAGVVLASETVHRLSLPPGTPVRSRWRRVGTSCACAVLLVSVVGGGVVLLAAPAARTAGLALLFVPLVVAAACAVVASLLLARRYGRAARCAALLGGAGLLLVCGVGGVYGPEPLPLAGLVCLLWVPAPVVAVAFVVLHGLRSPVAMSVTWVVGAAVAAVAAGLTVTGFAAQVVHGARAYAVHYGTVATTGLPDHCSTDVPGSGDSFGCPDSQWSDLDGNATNGTVYTDHRFWDRYGKYYSPGRLLVDPDDLPSPSIKITVYAIGDRAYMPGGTTTSARDAIGTPPLGTLAWAGPAVPVAFVVVLLERWMRRRGRTVGAAGSFVRGATVRRPARAGLAAAALLLLGLGTAGVLSPDPWPLPGLLCLLSAAAPLTALVFLRLHRRGGGPMSAPWLLLCAAGALAAATTAAGAAAAVIAHSDVYAQRYGAAATMKLPRTCRPVSEPASGRTADITECTNVTWTGPGGRTVRGTLHLSPRFWADYGGFYDEQAILDYVQTRPLLRDAAAKVRFPVRVSGHDAYLPGARSIAALGRPPLPWLSAAGVVLAAALVLVYVGRRPRRPHPAGPGTRTGTRTDGGAGRRTGGRVRAVTEGSAFVRVSVDASGLRVQRRTGASSGDGPWRDHLHLGWERIARMGFADERHGPAILYLLTHDGTRRYALDRRQLTDAQWRTVASAIAAATAGRITIDG